MTEVPPIGFDKTPKLIFLESCVDKQFPTASTCSLLFHLPTYHSNNEDFESKIYFLKKGHGGVGALSSIGPDSREHYPRNMTVPCGKRELT